MHKPLVWSERALVPEVADQVHARFDMVFPSSLFEQPYEHLEGAIAAFVGSLRFDAAVMDLAPDLLVIARTGIGVDGVDLEAANERAIAVCNAPEGPTTATAEHAITLAAIVAKSARVAADRLRAGESNLFGRQRAFEFRGRTMGLIGFGRIARQVAQIARGFGMSVLAHDPFVADAPQGISMVGDLHQLLGAADVVSVHVPLTPETAGLCDAAFFAAMKEGAVFVNSARGGLVVQEHLLAAVDEGHLFGAGLDVTVPEPLPPEHPLLNHPRIFVTPHIAAGTDEAKLGSFLGAYEAVKAVLDGRRPTTLVNPESWEQVASRIRKAL